jgi:hypothetical protein
VVPINGYDLWRITRGLEYPPEKFVQVLTQDTRNSHGFVLDNSGHSFSLALAKTISPADGGEQCVFWLSLDQGATGRCGIYGLRPAVCRTYPAIMHGTEVVRREDVMCPTEAWRDNILQGRRWRDDLFRVTVEFDIYRLAVGQWNRYVEAQSDGKAHTHEEYIAYLLDFYDALEGIRESEGEDNWDLMSEWWGTLRLGGVGPLVDTSIDRGEWSPVLDKVDEVVRSTIPVTSE